MIARAALVAVAVAAAAGSAAAQSTRYPPPAPDLDAEREAYSDFWEGAVEPGRDRYDELVARAQRLLSVRGPDARDTAIILLAEATQLLPARADAWAWLGIAREQAGDHEGCRDALERAWAIDPTWSAAPRPLPLALGVCRARTGDLEGAAEVLERLIARGEDTVEPRWRLGEVYMALGRLDDARATLDAAMSRTASEAGYPNAAWALVVAADRARDPQARAAAAVIALRNDGQRTRVEQPPGGFLDDTEADYYAAVAADVAGAPEVALLRFRRYLALAGDGPWAARAREHVRALRDVELRRRAIVDGTDRPDRAAAIEAVGKVEADLRQCVAEVPQLLVSLQVTTLGPKPTPAKPAPPVIPRREKTRRPRPGSPRVPPPRPPYRIGTPAPLPPAGVRASVVAGWETDDADVQAALTCVEKVGARLKLAPPKTPGTWARVTVPVIAR